MEESRLVARVINAETKLEDVTVYGSKVDNLFGTIENNGTVTIDGNKYIADGVLAKGMDENKLGIYSVKGFNWFAEQVNGGNGFSGKTVNLTVNIDLENKEWTPIGNGTSSSDNPNILRGTFDGNDNTISNLKVTAEGTDAAGLFTNSFGTIQNLKVTNVDITGHYKAGSIVGDGICAKVENCHVIGGTITSTPYNKNNANCVGGIVGYLSAESEAYVQNCSVDGLTIKAYRAVAGIAGRAYGANAKVLNNTVSNTAIIADQTDEYSEVKPLEAGEIVGSNLSNTDLSSNTATNVSIEIYAKDAQTLASALTGYEKRLQLY